MAVRVLKEENKVYDFNEISKSTDNEDYKKFDRDVADIIGKVSDLKIPDEESLRNKTSWRLKELLYAVERLYYNYIDED